MLRHTVLIIIKLLYDMIPDTLNTHLANVIQKKKLQDDKIFFHIYLDSLYFKFHILSIY